MKLSKKLVLGLVTGTVLGILGAIFLFSSPPVQKAEATIHTQWGAITWGACVSNGAQCGTDNGTQTGSASCVVGGSGNECHTYTIVCKEYEDIHGTNRNISQFYNKETGDNNHCHKIVWGNLSTEKQNAFKGYHSNSLTIGSPDHGTWEAAFNHHVSELGDIDYDFSNPEVKTDFSQACHTGVMQYDSCTPEGQCPTECGYDGGTVANGQGGEKRCEPTNSCSTRRWCFPDEESPTGYVAEAIPSDKTPDEGKPWESGKMVDKYCAYLPEGQCPTACGLGASEVNDGKGGILQCQATSACEQPKQETTSSSSPSSPSAPQCGETAPVKTGANFHVYRKGGDAILKWFPTEGGQANIYYKQVDANDWQYSLRDIANTGYVEIHDLGGLDITFALQQSRGCAGGPLTNAVVDGATDGWVLFR